jgi:hypothetical protein
MEKIRPNEVLNIFEYEKIRPQFRRHIIDLKKRRRIITGEKISLVFENRETVLSQIQEMMRAERIVDDRAIEHEVEVYNELIPEDGSLSATLFIEIDDLQNIRHYLDELLGIDDCITIQINNRYTIKGEFDPRQSREDRISAVHYLKFRFSPEDREAFLKDENEAVLTIDHPNYRYSAPILPEVKESLKEDFL